MRSYVYSNFLFYIVNKFIIIRNPTAKETKLARKLSKLNWIAQFNSLKLNYQMNSWTQYCTIKLK